MPKVLPRVLALNFVDMVNKPCVRFVYFSYTTGSHLISALLFSLFRTSETSSVNGQRIYRTANVSGYVPRQPTNGYFTTTMKPSFRRVMNAFVVSPSPPVDL
jgi:hypothetical protein